MGKFKTLDLWDPSDSAKFKNQKLENHKKAKSINLYPPRNLIDILLKRVWRTPFFLLSFSRYWSLKVGLYYHPVSWVQGTKWLKFQWKSQINIMNLSKLICIVKRGIHYTFKKLGKRPRTLLPCSRYWCLKACRYYHKVSRVRGMKLLKLQWERKKSFWIY